MKSATTSPTPTGGLLAVFERLVLYTLLMGLWILVESPILNALLFREKYGLYICPISFVMVCAFRYKQGGYPKVVQETKTVATDLTFPAWFLYQTVFASSRHETTTEWTREFLIRLATLTKYLVIYGPLSFAGIIMLVAPFPLAVLQPMLYQPWFPLLKWLTLVYCTLMFCGIATNSCMHRFFSHSSMKSTRVGTFVLGFIGCLGGQFGPLWWASNHRRHHKYCETPLDVHCPAIQGFFYSHCGWIMDSVNFPIREEYLPKVGKDWPELLLLDVFCTNIQFTFFYGFALLLGYFKFAPVEADAPGFILKQVVIGVEEGYVLTEDDVAAQFVDTALILGYALSMHAEFLINSWCHAWTIAKSSKDNGGTCKGLDFYWVGLLNAGEGFHANHHQFPAQVQHGPKWYYDWSYTFIAILEKMGIVWDVVRAPATKKQI